MPSEEKAAFIKWGSFSHTNESVLDLLRKRFPGFSIETIDLFTDLVGNRDVMAILHSLREYGWDIFLGRKTLGQTYLRTPYIFDMIREAVLLKLSNRGYAFTLQTQSMFDASIPGTPHFVYTDHTHLANLQDPRFDPRRLYSSAWIAKERDIYHNATINFTMSTNVSRSIIEDYGCSPDKVACVYGGANVSPDEDEILNDERYASKNILFVGVDWRMKGGPTLTEAFKTVLASHPDATLTIVGCSPTPDVPNCRVLGVLPPSLVKPCYQSAALFCLPTTLEAFGIAFLEAMTHRLPVIGTRIGALPEFILDGKNGFLVEPNDPALLAERILQLLKSPSDCKAFGEYGHGLIRERYTWDNTGERMAEIMKPFIAQS